MKTKGISPLIAAVLLIAITMTIAGLLAYWGSTFIRGQTDQFSNQTISSACNFQKFKIDACSYNPGTGTLTFILDNTGTYELRNMSVIAFYPDLTISSMDLTDKVVGRGKLQSFPVGPVTAGFSKIEIRTQCPESREETTCQ